MSSEKPLQRTPLNKMLTGRGFKLENPETFGFGRQNACWNKGNISFVRSMKKGSAVVKIYSGKELIRQFDLSDPLDRQALHDTIITTY